MTINWAEFTPLMSFSGGVLIGAAALFLMLTKGRIMGVRVICSRPLKKTTFLVSWGQSNGNPTWTLCMINWADVPPPTVPCA